MQFKKSATLPDSLLGSGFSEGISRDHRSFSSIDISALSEAANEQKLRVVDLLDRVCQPQLSEQLSALLGRVSKLYAFSDQYHSSEHMYRVARAVVELAELTELPKTPKKIASRLVRAAFHDTANIEHPSLEIGLDERIAIKNFMVEFDPRRTEHGLDFLLEIEELLGAQEKLEIICGIAGTVFADRFSCESVLKNRPYIRDIANELRFRPDWLGISDTDIAQYALSLGLGVNSPLEEVIAHGAQSPESLLLKHADLIGLVEPEYAFKDSITNRAEDQSKAHIASEKDPAAYTCRLHRFRAWKVSQARWGFALKSFHRLQN